MVALTFDATKVEPSAGLDPVPAGWYKMMIDESGPSTPAKSNPANSYMPFRFTILEGQYKNKKVFIRLNLVNSNPEAQEIAHRELSAIAHAVGVLQLTMTEQLHNIPMWCSVSVRKGNINPATNETYNDSNEIKSYKPISFVPPNTGTTTAAPVAQPVVPPPPAPVATPPAVTYEMAPGEQFTREQYLANGWTNEALIAANKMRVVQVAPPPPPPPPPPPVATPAASAGWASAPKQPWEPPASATTSAPPPPPPPPTPAVAAAQSADAPWNKPAA